MNEKGLPKYFSKEIKKAEIKYHIKTLLKRLKTLNKKIIVKDPFHPDEKPYYQDYGNSQKDFIEIFHENNSNKINFLRNNISNLLKENIYIKYGTKKEKDLDNKSNVYANLIDELIEGEKKEEENIKPKKFQFLGNKVDFYKYYKIHRKKMDKLKGLGLTEKMNKSQPVIYNPNYDYIHKRIISGPEWKKISGRNQINKTKNMKLPVQSNKNNLKFKCIEKDISDNIFYIHFLFYIYSSIHS